MRRETTSVRYTFIIIAAMGVACVAPLASWGQEGPASGTDGGAIVQTACGKCHALEIVLAAQKTKNDWLSNVNDMISKGAQVNPGDVGAVVDYLATHTPVTRAASPAGGQAASARGTAFRGRGPNDWEVPDPASAKRGQALYVVQCVACHGAGARGGGDDQPPALQGPDLVRSNLVFHDRDGSTLGPFLKKDHPLQSGKPSTSLSDADVVDLSSYLHQQIGDTITYVHFLNVLTGDAKAGETYFNGEGKCATCHSPAGDLAGIAKRYDPPNLQQQFLFPMAVARGAQGNVIPPKPVVVTVTSPDGSTVSGDLVHLDDFSVSLTDSAGIYHAWQRSSLLKVEKKNPYQAHIDLLDHITDKHIHDVVAYLETLQ